MCSACSDGRRWGNVLAWAAHAKFFSRGSELFAMTTTTTAMTAVVVMRRVFLVLRGRSFAATARADEHQRSLIYTSKYVRTASVISPDNQGFGWPLRRFFFAARF